MKPEQQRIAIAEACGWRIETDEYFKILREPNKAGGLCCGLHLSDLKVWEAGLTGDENGDFRFPDYLNDLNAMHEAEKQVLCKNVSLYMKYGRLLTEQYGVIDAIFSTAAQRAEAFLKTLGLWKD